MKIEVREDSHLQLEDVFSQIVIKVADGTEFYICEATSYGIEVTCNGVTMYLTKTAF
jgi:hypothetical protein